MEVFYALWYSLDKAEMIHSNVIKTAEFSGNGPVYVVRLVFDKILNFINVNYRNQWA
jgi:hypothetical protein